MGRRRAKVRPNGVGGGFHGNYSADYLDPLADRRITDLALQLRLGLLSQWRLGVGAGHYYHFAANGTLVRTHQTRL